MPETKKKQPDMAAFSCFVDANYSATTLIFTL